ncbi:DUF1153 domain-containing protein [Sphingomonas solaris]|uniref:DUF1153 domain-containing protein n=1 Tax=Alterirhizorhabdus solaris TaxID=2529389 RepID=UPI001396992E|nr:DUF1153 domain-containing protein [Sphingomonas solaris]
MEYKFTRFALEVSREVTAEVTEADLPPRYNRRWTSAMKARVVAAIDSGLLSADEASRRYNLAPAELAIWQDGMACAPVFDRIDPGHARLRRSLHPVADASLGSLIDIRL